MIDSEVVDLGSVYYDTGLGCLLQETFIEWINFEESNKNKM